MEKLKNAGDGSEIDRDVVESLYEDYWKAERLVETLTESVNLEVSDSEAKVITVDEIVLSDKDQADEALKKVQMEGTDFMIVAKEVSEDQEIEKKISRGLRPEAYEKAAYALATGETSDVIEADGKYYILRCVNDYDEAATKVRKEEMVLEDGKFYTVMDVRREKDADSEGKTVDPDVLSLSEDSRMLYGDYLIRTKNPVLLTYLKEEETKLLRFIEDLSAKAGDSERAAERLSELKLQLKENQEVQHEMQGDH